MRLKNYKILSTQYLRQISPQPKQKIETQAYQWNIVNRTKEKRKLRREFIKTKDIILKGKLNKVKKDIRSEIRMERNIQWKKKLRKVKVSSNADDWKEIKIVLRLGKDKLLYPDLVGSESKKVVTDKENIKLFEETIKQIFCTEIPTESNLLEEKKKLKQVTEI